jgi:hypothetical protein
MNAPQKWISVGFICALFLCAIYVPWKQTYKGIPFNIGSRELGDHPLWRRPPATGGMIGDQVVPVSECKVSIDRDQLILRYRILIVLAALLVFVARTRPLPPSGAPKRVSDWQYAGLAALVLVGIAALIVFVIRPGGFFEVVELFYVLLPGAFIPMALGRDLVEGGSLDSILWAISVFGASLLWYFAISDAVIAIYRVLARPTRLNTKTQ